MSNKYRTLASNTLLMTAGTFSSKVLVFLMVRFYTGCLTPEEYGTADLITQTANLLIPVASLDITDGVFRFAADRKSRRSDVFSVGLGVIAAGMAVMLLIMLLMRGIPAVRDYGLLLALYIAATCSHTLCSCFVRAKGRTALFALQGLINTALVILFNILFLAWFRLGVVGYVTATANLVTASILIAKERLWRYIKPLPSLSLARRMLRYCIPLIPAGISWWIMGVSDRYMVDYFLGSGSNGIYAVSYKIPTILTILATVFIDAWQLSAIAEAGGGRREHLKFYGKIWDAFISAVYMCAGGLITFSPLLIRILADEPYYSAWQYIPMLTLSMAAAAFSHFMGSVYVVTKDSMASFWSSTAGAAVNIALNLWLIPLIGIQGAATATFGSCLVVFIMRTVSAHRMMPFKLSGRKLILGALVLLIQTAFMLFRWPGWAPMQAASLFVLFLLGLKPMIFAAQVILQRR